MAHGFTTGLREVRVAHLFNFLCSPLCFVCPHPVSCVPTVAGVSRLSILDCLFGFLLFQDQNVFSTS